MNIKDVLAKIVELDGVFHKVNIFRHLKQITTDYIAVFDTISEADTFFKYAQEHCCSAEWERAPYEVRFAWKEKK